MKIKCDICRKEYFEYEVDDLRSSKILSIKQQKWLGNSGTHEFEYNNFCNECTNKIKRFMVKIAKGEDND